MAEDGLSIVIPVLNEDAVLNRQLSLLQQQLKDLSRVEIIVSDGGSTDNTLATAQAFDCRMISGPAGRARQLNHGASVARYPWILFLHADTCLPGEFYARVQTANEWGFFKLQLSGQRLIFRLIEFMISWRSAFSGISTGDQAQFFRRDFFNRIGGYPDIPLMEDVAISKRAKQHAKPSVISSYVTTSSRRWEQNGVLKTIVLMWWLRFAYWIGISTHRLHRWYYPEHD